MTTLESQNENDENYFEVVGINDGRDSASMDQFISTLEGEFQYPVFTHTGDKTEAEIAAEILGDEGTEVDDEVVDDTPPPVEPAPTEDEGTPPPPPPAPDTVLVNGNPVPLSDIQRLYEFDQYLKSNPEAAQRVQQAVTTSEPAIPPTPAPEPPHPVTVDPPDFLDMEDPAQKFMWESHVANQQQIQSIAQRDAAREQEVINRRAVADMDTALSKFRTLHPNFNDDQISTLRQHAASMNIIGAVMATTPDPVSALVRVMDVAALDNPDLRTVYLTPSETPPTPTRKQKQATTKGKLNALGGSSGSIPRTTTTPLPMSDREAKEQFAQGLAESLGLN